MAGSSTTSGENQRDYIDSIGAFFLLNKKGQLVALNSLIISDDLSAIVPKALMTDLTAMYPLVESIKPSSILLSVKYGPSPQSHYLMQVNMGGTKQTLKAPGKTMDILTNSLENGNFPVIAQT
ncbi:MAG: hypothetical protein HOI95_18735, partial [Chromatiales bacterium]|nr:hypothetical protein [Chromatiales bacterium]